MCLNKTQTFSSQELTNFWNRHNDKTGELIVISDHVGDCLTDAVKYLNWSS